MHSPKYQQGMTLVEVLAVVVIASFVSIGIYGALSFGLKQFENQNVENRQLMDSAFAFKVITKDIRKSDDVLINGEDSCTAPLCIDGLPYSVDALNQLNKEDMTLAKNVESFYVHIVDNVAFIQIKMINGKTDTTEINLR